MASSPTPSTPVIPRMTPEEEARQDRQRRLIEMIRKGRLDILKTFWEKHPTEFDSSALGIAAASGEEDIIKWLLEEAKLDPTVPIDGKRAYDLCTTRSARNVFRRFAFQNPEMYDWTAANVPSGLSAEQEASQDKKKVERRKGLREKLKEREKTRSEAEVAEPESEPEVKPVLVQKAPTSGPQKLGGRLGGEGGLSGLNQNMRLQIERERRARAAEARLR